MMMIENELKQEKPSQELLDLYRLRRKLRIEIMERFVKNIPMEVLRQAAKQLGLYYKKSITFEKEQELDILFNHAIFHYLHNEKKLIERYVCEAISSKKISEEKLEMLDRLQNVSYGVFAVVETLPYGGATVTDGLSNKTLLLMDEGFSCSAYKGLMIAASYLTFPEFVMTTGVALPIFNFGDNLQELINEIDIEDRLFFELPIKQQTRFIARLTKHCLESRVLDHMGFVE